MKRTSLYKQVMQIVIKFKHQSKINVIDKFSQISENMHAKL